VNFEKLGVGKRKLAKDNTKALVNGSSVAGLQVGGKVGVSDATVCETCGEKVHKMITSKKCLMSTNPNSEHFKK
jgi:hypothetical protein